MSICMVGGLATYSFLRAEDVTAFSPNGHYEDLLTFEMDVAQISQLILLFCESVGSYAELGSFCIEREITQRLLVVVDDNKYQLDSFVRWGPLKYLEDIHTNAAVCVLNTDEISQGRGALETDIDKDAFHRILERSIRARVRAAAREHQSFDPTKSGHMIKLITGLIQDYGALLEEEVDVIMYCIGHPISSAAFRRYALCAEAFGWIKKDRRDLFTYYTATSQREAIRFKFTHEPIDRSRWRTDIIQHWKTADPARFESIQANRPSS